MQTQFQNNTLRLLFPGDILSTNVGEIRVALLGHLSAYPMAGAVIADLGLSNLIDSQGLNLLVALFRECERRQVSFRVENPVPDIQRLFTALKLAERFGLVPAVTPAAVPALVAT
jgi:anti-anti-sigma factor